VTLSGSDSDGYVDPSLIKDGNDTYLFYLPGTIGSDPAGCSSYPCTKEIHSAPDILKFGSTYLPYVTTSTSGVDTIRRAATVSVSSPSVINWPTGW
jgi:hypothetical protein